MIYFTKLKDGRALAFNTSEEMESFERSWRGLMPANRQDPHQDLLGIIQAAVLGKRERATAEGARFNDYVTVIALPDEAVQPPKPPGRRRKQATAAAPAPV